MIEDLHKRMGHISPGVVKKMVEDNLVDRVKLDELSNIRSCDSCEYAKAHRKPIWKEQKLPHASNLGEETHSDMWGLAPVQTINGREYYVPLQMTIASILTSIYFALGAKFSMLTKHMRQNS